MEKNVEVCGSGRAFVFTKMHVNGNDFLLVNGMVREYSFDPNLVRHLGDRYRGVGFDQLLLIQPPKDSNNDASVSFFNSNGSGASQCGNGCAAVTAFLQRHKLVIKPTTRLETTHFVTECTVIACSEHKGYSIEVSLGKPTFDPAEIPFLVEEQQCRYELTLPGHDKPVSTSVLSLGNPHAVIVVPSVDEVQLEVVGSKVQDHVAFPKSTNVEILEVLDDSNGKLRVYERGAGETQACGTGAAAAMVAGRLLDRFSTDVNISMPGGQTTVKWENADHPVLIQCNPTFLFTGTWTSTNL